MTSPSVRMGSSTPVSKSSSTRACQSQIHGKNAVCKESSATVYGVFDCEFDFDSHEWSRSNATQVTASRLLTNLAGV